MSKVHPFVYGIISLPTFEQDKTKCLLYVRGSLSGVETAPMFAELWLVSSPPIAGELGHLPRNKVESETGVGLLLASKSGKRKQKKTENSIVETASSLKTHNLNWSKFLFMAQRALFFVFL